MKKVAVLASQAGSPIFGRLGKCPEIDLTVYYCSDISAGKPDFNYNFGIKIDWGTSAVVDHRHKFLKNFLPQNFSAKNNTWLNFGIIKEIAANKYDTLIIFGWNMPTAWLAFFTAMLYGIPFIIFGENPQNQEILKTGLLQKIKKLILRWLFKKTTAFLYIGEENRRFYLSYNIPEKKMFPFPWAVNNDYFMDIHQKTFVKRAAYRAELNIEKEAVVVIFVGSFIEKKRPMDLLRAYKQLIISYPQTHLIFVGDGKLKKVMEDYIKEHNLKNVHLAGFKSHNEIGKYYAVSDIFALPSGMGETWGQVVNEAMCFSLPVTVSDLVGSAKDLVQTGENGYTFPCGDILKLSECLKSLIADPAKRKNFGKKSLQIVEKYSYKKEIEGILGALNFLI